MNLFMFIISPFFGSNFPTTHRIQVAWQLQAEEADLEKIDGGGSQLVREVSGWVVW